jgi:hypothetical protein
MTILGFAGISGRHSLLQIDGTLHGVHRTAELDQNTITGELEDAAPCLVTRGPSTSFRRAFSAARVPASSASMSRL